MPVYPGALRVPDNPSGISAVTSLAPISEAEALAVLDFLDKVDPEAASRAFISDFADSNSN